MKHKHSLEQINPYLTSKFFSIIFYLDMKVQTRLKLRNKVKEKKEIVNDTRCWNIMLDKIFIKKKHSFLKREEKKSSRKHIKNGKCLKRWKEGEYELFDRW